MSALLALPATDKLPAGYESLAAAAPTIADDLAEIIAARAWRKLDCPRAYLTTLGYPAATLDEHLPEAEDKARALLERMCRRLRDGIG